jgi:alpha-tubulin suppressor-like RCC1 family protein
MSSKNLLPAAGSGGAQGTALYLWGNNNYGQMGNNLSVILPNPKQIGTSSDWTNIAAGATISATTPVLNAVTCLARKSDGTLWGWGAGSTSVGNNTTINYSSPVQIGALTTWTNNISSAALTRHAVDSSGRLWTWGAAAQGSQGLNSTAVSYSSPVQVGALTNWNKLAGGGNAVFAIKTDGTLWSWGGNNEGVLGQSIPIATARSSPTQIGALTSWAEVSAGPNFAAAVRTNGTLWTWGINNTGQLGAGATTVSRSSPTQVGALTNWSKVHAKTDGHCLAIKTDGTLWAWGLNSLGQLGDGTTINRSSPVQIGARTDWVSLGSGPTSSFAIDASGNLWAWGSNDNNVTLGTGTGRNYSSPVQIGSATWLKAPDYGCQAIQANGTLWSWGPFSTGANGNETPQNYISPILLDSYNWASVSAGNSHVLGLKQDGTLWAWGSNLRGELGTSDTTYYQVPIQIGSATDWAKVSAGMGQVPLFAQVPEGSGMSFAVKTNGTLWAWGYNAVNGTLGLNDLNNRSSPTQIGALTTWSDVYAGSIFTFAKRTNGTLWAWGYNVNGELGINNRITQSSPVQVGTATNWSKVFPSASVGGSTTARHTLAIQTNGTLWAWGSDSYGALGVGGARANRSVPTQVGALTTWAEAAASGFAYSLAIKTDGTLWSWGDNASGQLGSGTIIPRSSPVQVGSLTNWSKVAAHGNTVTALKTDGTIWGWGTQPVGDGTTINRSSPVQIGSLTNWTAISLGVSPRGALSE